MISRVALPPVITSAEVTYLVSHVAVEFRLYLPPAILANPDYVLLVRTPFGDL
jgi:hypothetical protein